MGKPTYRQQELERVLALIAKIPTGWKRYESMESTSYEQLFGGYAIVIQRIGHIMQYCVVYVGQHRVLRGRRARRIWRIRTTTADKDRECRMNAHIDKFLDYAQRTFIGEGDVDQ